MGTGNALQMVAENDELGQANTKGSADEKVLERANGSEDERVN